MRTRPYFIKFFSSCSTSDKMERPWFAFIILCSWFVLSRSVHSEDGVGVLSYLDSDAVVSGSPSNPLMVSLTLIQGADSKGAGIFYFSIYS